MGIKEKGQLQEDAILEQIKEDRIKDCQMIEEFLDKIAPVIREALEDEQSGFNLKHAFLALSRAQILLSQSYCDSPEHFKSETEKAEKNAIEKVIPSLMPKMEGDKIIEENYDMENLSLRRVIMTLASALDYAFWKTDVKAYTDLRNAAEEKEKQEQENI